MKRRKIETFIKICKWKQKKGRGRLGTLWAHSSSNYGFPVDIQSQAQGHFGSLSALWSPNNNLWENGILSQKSWYSAFNCAWPHSLAMACDWFLRRLKIEYMVLYDSGWKEERNYLSVRELKSHRYQSKVEFINKRKILKFFLVYHPVLLEVWKWKIKG